MQRHRYKDFPGEEFHSYEWCGVVDTHGRAVQTLSTDERLCPSHTADGQAEIEAALGVAPGTLDAR